MNSAARNDRFVPSNLASGARRAHDVRVAESPLSPHHSDAPPSWLTGRRALALIAGWLVVAFLAAPALGLYYEARASLYLLPPLVLVYGYCLSHRRRTTTVLALIATVVVVFAIGLAWVIPKAASATTS
jgi:hypothetical protein